jgi:hypothetical protein
VSGPSAQDHLPYHRAMPAARRFRPPWIVEQHNNACFIVKDATGQAPRVRPRHAVDLCQQPSVGARYVPVSARNRCAVDFRGTTIVMQARRYKSYAIDGVVPVIDPTAFVHPDVLQGVRLTVRSH